MSQNPTLFPFLIQRRLPGVQGENGCWCDVTTVEAEDAEDAMKKWSANALLDPNQGVHEGIHRAGIAPAWERFVTKIERVTSQQVVVERG